MYLLFVYKLEHIWSKNFKMCANLKFKANAHTLKLLLHTYCCFLLKLVSHYNNTIWYNNVIYVYIYSYMCIYTYIYIYIYIYVYIWININICMDIPIYKYMDRSVFEYINKYIYIYILIYWKESFFVEWYCVGCESKHVLF